jgi:hypothetical protein
MSSGESKGLFDRVRGVRDSAMEDVAKVTLAWTSSDAYQALNAGLSKPALLMASVFRKAVESAMADLLAKLNLPSREDVLALSQRLTRIEMTLDDVGAGMERLRRELGPPEQHASKEARSHGNGRPSVAPTLKES